MINKTQRQVPKIVAFILLTIITVLMIIVGNKGGFLNFFDFDNRGNAEQTPPTPPPPTTDNGGKDPEIPGGGSPDGDITVETPDLTQLPKNALSSEFFTFNQYISGDKDVVLLASHPLTGNTITIVKSFSSKGDMNTPGGEISLFLSDKNGNLIKRTKLDLSISQFFIESQITNQGLAIVTYSGKNMFVSLIDTEFDKIISTELENCNSAKIFALQDSFLIIGKTENASIAYTFKDKVIFKTKKIKQLNIISIMAFANYYMIFGNNADSYSIIKMTFLLETIEETIIYNKKIKDVLPISEGKLQKFVLAEISQNSLILTKYNANFDIENTLSIPVSTEQEVELFKNNEQFLILLSQTKRILLIDKNLDLSLSDSKIYEECATVFTCFNYKSSFILLMSDDNNSLNLLEIKQSGNITKKSLFATSQKAYMTANPVGILIAYEVYENDMLKVKLSGISNLPI